MEIGSHVIVNVKAEVVYKRVGQDAEPVRDIQGMTFEILRELAEALYRSPGELVPFSKLERYSEGEDARASQRVRVREIKDALGKAHGLRSGAADLIINVRDRGYRLVPPRE